MDNQKFNCKTKNTDAIKRKYNVTKVWLKINKLSQIVTKSKNIYISDKMEE